MGNPQQVVWDDEQKAAPAAAPSSVQWDDAGQAKPAAVAAPRVAAPSAPASIAPPSGMDWLMHPFKSAGQSIDIASQYYGAKGDKDESIAKGVGKSLGRTATMIPNIVAHPYDSLVGGNIELMNRSREEAAQGKTPESMLHSVAAGVPLFGPMAVSIGERIGGTREAAPTKSDIAGGLTDAATLALLPKVSEMVKEGAAPGGVLRRGVTSPMTPVGEGAPAFPTVRGVVDAAANTTPGRQAIAAGKYVIPAVKGFASDIPGVKGAVQAVKNVKAAKAAMSEADARAADYKMAQEQGELARSGAKDAPQNREIPVLPEGRPEGFPTVLTEKTYPNGRVEILGPGDKPFAGERSSPRLTEREVAEKAKQRGLTPDQFKEQLRKAKSTPTADIGASQTTETPAAEAPASTPDISASPEKSVLPNMGEWQTPSFEELSSNIKRVGRAGESKAAKAIAEQTGEGHVSMGQFAKANGPRIDAAVPNTPEGQTLANHIHSITNRELGQLAERLKVDIGGKQVGAKGISRSEVFNKMLDAGHSPEDIVNAHYERVANPPSVSGGAPDMADPNLQRVRQRLADPHVRAENHIGNMMMADKFISGERLPSRIGALNDLASQAKTASPEELQEFDRMGRNQYNEVKSNIANAYKEAPKTTATPNIAEAPAQAPKVWRDAPGEQHPVKIVYDEHGQPTAETDGRHRVIQALKNGYDRIEVIVDRGNGPVKTTVPVRALARQMGVDEASLANTDSQQSYRAGGGKPRIAITKQ